MRIAITRRALLRGAIWTVVIFAALELTARRYISRPFPCLMGSRDPELLFTLRPGHYRSNGYLERLPEASYEVRGDGCQHLGRDPALLALGSSHGFGLAVERRDAFPEALREALAARGHALRGTRNCSVPGHHFLQQVRAAELALARRAHPLVVVLVASHHLQRAQDWSRMAPSSALARWITARSRLARLAHLLRMQRGFEARARRYEPPERLREGLLRLDRAARARGGRAAVLLLGAPRHERFDFAREAARAGVTVVQLGVIPQGPSWTFDGEHWTARGHREVARRALAPLDALLRAPR